MIDTHCHLYLPEFKDDLVEVMNRAAKAGVHKYYLPAIDSGTFPAMVQLEERYKDKCFAMIGLHPCSVKENYEQELEKIEKQLKTRRFAAIGETGLDLYWDKTFYNEQIISLKKQIELGLQYNLPVVLHTRNATMQTIEIIESYAGKNLKGVFHCFGGNLEEAERIIDTGFFLGIGGVITYKNAGLAEVLKDVDLKHIVLETDAPYLTPEPHRGKRNESSYLSFIAEKIALIKNVSVQIVDEVTTANAVKVFG